MRALRGLIVGSTLGAVMALAGCSYLTAQGRQQRAYEKYVRRASTARAHQRSKFKSKDSRMPVQHSPTESAPEQSVEQQPQSETQASSESAQ